MRSKFTKARRDSIIRILSKGGTYRMACAAVGISEKTFYRWLDAGKNENAKSTQQKFVDDVMKANARGGFIALECIQTEAAKNWKAAAWLLERRYNYRRDSKIHTQLTIEQPTDKQPATPKEIVWQQLTELQNSMNNAKSSGSWQAYAALQRAYMSSYREYRELCDLAGDYDQMDTLSDQQLIDQITEVYIGLPPVIRDEIHTNITEINKSVIEFKK